MGKAIWLHGRIYIKSLVFRHIMLLYAWNSLLKYVLRTLVVDSFNFNLQGSAEFVCMVLCQGKNIRLSAFLHLSQIRNELTCKVPGTLNIW